MRVSLPSARRPAITASATPGPPKRPSSSRALSGNRAGRPKGRPSLNEIILEEAARIAKVKVGENVLHIDKDRALMRRLFDLGLHGNVPALRYAMSLLAQAQAELSDTADPEEPLTEEELAVLNILSKRPGK